MSEQRKVCVRIGWADITDVRHVNTTRSLNMKNEGATVVVPAKELLKPGVSFAGNVVVTAELNGQVQTIFTGVVDRVDLSEDGSVRIEVGSLKRELETTRTGGLQIGDGCDPREIIYALARHAGLSHDRINIEGWAPGPTETFLVTVPIAGMAVGAAREIGGVLFTGTNPARMDLSDGELRQQFLAGPVWGTATVEAATIGDAETKGLEKILTAVGIVRAAAYYSYPAFDGVTLRTFDWRHTQARPVMLRLAFVGSITSPRRWLRGTHDVPNIEPLNLEDLSIPSEAKLATGLPAKRVLQRALREWHASVDAADEVGRVAHLWRAMECFVAGVRSERLFEPGELRQIGESIRAAQSWNSEQASRLDELIGRLNEAPLLRKLRTAVQRDGIDVTESEFAALASTRSLRNDLEHGRTLNGEQQRELDVATAVANRIIVQALIGLANAS